MTSQIKSKGSKFFILVLFSSILAVIIIWILVETIRAGNTGFEEQNLWEWMKLLIVPLLIPVSLLWLTRRTQENEKALANYKATKEELQNYFDRMTELLLKHSLKTSAEDSETRSIARSITFAVAPELNSVQKGQLLIFLYDAGLIFRYSPILNLGGVDLQKVSIMPKADLRRISLRGANLQNSKFERANFYYADFKSSKMQNTNLIGAILLQASLRDAILIKANLREASIKDADLRWANLSHANLEEANLEDADLRRADLQNANFKNAVLINTKLNNALVSKTQLQEARLLRNVTMPDGAIYSSGQS